jgi:hypothetical protein
MSAVTPLEVPRFDVAQAVTPVGTAPCAECRSRIVDTYFEWDGKVICAACQPRLAANVASPTTGSVVRAIGLGLAAAIAGTALYYALTAVTGRDLAWAMIPVGFGIGKAVRFGSGGRGGRRYQWLAACLTYATIASTYVPFVTSGFGDRTPAAIAAAEAPAVASPTSSALASAGSATSTPPAAAAPIPVTRPGPAHLAALLLLATAAPVLVGFGNILGITITIVAVIVAWRLNRAVPEAIAGPFQVSASR